MEIRQDVAREISPNLKLAAGKVLFYSHYLAEHFVLPTICPKTRIRRSITMEVQQSFSRGIGPSRQFGAGKPRFNTHSEPPKETADFFAEHFGRIPGAYGLTRSTLAEDNAHRAS